MMSSGVLDLPVPLVAYTVLHRSEGDLLGTEYESTMQELHTKIAGETERLHTSVKKALQDLVARESQMLLGALSQYLETPIQSDRVEVQRALTDALERVGHQLLARPRLGVLTSSEAKIVFPSTRRTVERKMLQNGKEYLTELGLLDARQGDLYESAFLVEGSGNLDILEFLLRERVNLPVGVLGEPTTGAHPGIFTLYNLTYRLGVEAPLASSAGKFELMLAFNKPRLKQEEFRQSLVSALEGAYGGRRIEHLSIWQRKLGLGRVREYLVRCIGAENQSWEETAQALFSASESEPLSSLLTGAALMVKECQHRSLSR